jgi:short-subunit dehydrogenase
MQLAGRRVLVTGASRGIGEAIARRCASAGAALVLVARSEGQLRELAADVGGTWHTADLADREAVDGLIARIEADGGPIDVLVNNAGIELADAFVDMSAAGLEQIYRINLIAPVELCRQALPGMLERGRGHIVNVSSLSGVAPFPGLATYGSTKSGLTQFTAGLRADLKGRPIGTTLVELGPIPTGMLSRAGAYKPTDASFRRFYRLQILVEIPREQVADAVVDAIMRNRRHVRLPKRAAITALLAEAPRRLVEIALAGVPHQAEQ